MSLTIEKGDITSYAVDAIVNAANSTLLGGGGVDGAIHRAAGPELLAECRTLGGCECGQAKITKAYRLNAKYVIHTVGPIYYEHTKEESRSLLKKCYLSSINIAKAKGLKSIAFPLISAGAYAYPKEEALKEAIDTLLPFANDFELILVLFDKEALEIAKQKFSSYIK